MKLPWSKDSHKLKSHAPIDVGALQSSLRAERARKRKIIGMVVLACVLATATWIFFASPYMRIQHIEVTGNAETKSEDIVRFLGEGISGESWFHALLGQNYLFLWPQGSAPVNTQLLPHVRTLDVSVDYGSRTIRIAVSERELFGIWCHVNNPSSTANEGTPLTLSGEASSSTEVSSSTEPVIHSPRECFWFDRDGLALGPAPFGEGNIIPVIQDYSGMQITPASHVLNDQEMKHFLSILHVLATAGVSASEISLHDRSLEEIVVQATLGPKLLFSLRFSADPALTVLNFLWGGGGSQKLSTLEYVDFRTENRAFYK